MVSIPQGLDLIIFFQSQALQGKRARSEIAWAKKCWCFFPRPLCRRPCYPFCPLRVFAQFYRKLEFCEDVEELSIRFPRRIIEVRIAQQPNTTITLHRARRATSFHAPSRTRMCPLLHCAPFVFFCAVLSCVTPPASETRNADPVFILCAHRTSCHHH